MRLWEAETGGATYWVVASDIELAIAMLFACWRDEGVPPADMDDVSIERVYDERAQKVRFRGDGEGPACSMAEEAARHKGPAVIACSEWP